MQSWADSGDAPKPATKPEDVAPTKEEGLVRGAHIDRQTQTRHTHESTYTGANKRDTRTHRDRGGGGRQRPGDVGTMRDGLWAERQIGADRE